MLPKTICVAKKFTINLPDIYHKAVSYTHLIDAISLEATEMGRPLYEEFGFVGMKDEMELK